jgi:hypothetical protein
MQYVDLKMFTNWTELIIAPAVSPFDKTELAEMHFMKVSYTLCTEIMQVPLFFIVCVALWTRDEV